MGKLNGSPQGRIEADRYLAGDPEMVRQTDAWIDGELMAGAARSSAEREDLKQLVHLKLLQNLQKRAFRNEASFRTYACRIARFTVIDFLRRGRVEQVRDRSPFVATYRSPQRTLETRELSGQIQLALTRCPDHCQELWRLIAERELTYPQIADRLGIPVGTVKSRVWHCRRYLAAALEIGGGRQHRGNRSTSPRRRR